MVEIRHILCPVDFSDASKRALEHAVTIARWYRATVHLVHVAMPMPPVSRSVGGAEGLAETTRQALAVELEAVAEPIRSSGVTVEVALREGYVVPVVLAEARAAAADLIVAGTHGYGGFERFVLGSVTEKLLRKAPCPVLAVPPVDEPPASEGRFSSIVCPVDFSSTTEASVALALSLAQEAGGSLWLLHVLGRPELHDWPERFQVALDEAQADQAMAATERLAAMVPEAARDWCQPEVIVDEGRPSDRILAVAEARGADLIVMGTHGRHFVTRALVGSTTSAVIRRAGCPVLTVVPKEN